MKPLNRTFAALMALPICLALWACNKDTMTTASAQTRSAQQQAQPTRQGGMPGTGGHMMGQRYAGCPMGVQGAEVSVADTDGGVALTFTTAAGDVAGLRTRVRSMAQRYGMQRGHGGMRWHRMGGKGMGGKGMGQLGGRGMAGRGPIPAASHTVTDIDKGARLELRPTDASQLDALRERVRRHQQRMHSGQCWMPRAQSTKTPQQKKE